MGIRDILRKNLRDYRKGAGYSQEELAHAAGLHRTYVSGVERGVRNPTVEVLDKLAKPLNIPTWKLLDDGQE
ncbi:helix-turn-helix transcriptional regulator [Henriciella sp.]|uniref:helix-turn-helix domain-containing protein n=1 Tax=Henriciella sp. TaxID=1968823 RepID=UPI00261E9C97|nr:helix-turn-helix transcriptional regulator [Henriciella sp.]